MTNETIDELIDRVAAEMTSVRPDVAMSARVRQGLADRPRRLLLPVAAVVLAVAVITVTQWHAWTNHAKPLAQESLPARPLVSWAILRQAAASSAAFHARNMTASAASPLLAARSATRVWVWPDEDTALPALAVTELEIVPLAGPALAEIAPLDLAPIAIPELESVKDASKEWR